MSAPIQIRAEGQRVVLDIRDSDGASVIALRLSPLKAVEVASALIEAASSVPADLRNIDIERDAG